MPLAMDGWAKVTEDYNKWAKMHGYPEWDRQPLNAKWDRRPLNAKFNQVRFFCFGF